MTARDELSVQTSWRTFMACAIPNNQLDHSAQQLNLTARILEEIRTEARDAQCQQRLPAGEGFLAGIREQDHPRRSGFAAR